MGAVILAAVAAPRSIVPRFLALTPIRYVGRISYGLYIWHWPIFIWLNHERTGLFGWELFTVRVAVTFAVSVISFHLVERPIRMGTFISQWRAWLVVPVGVGAVLVALIAATTGTTAVASIPSVGIGTGNDTTTTTTVPGAAPGAQPVRVLLFGDSVALTLGLGLADSTDQDKYGYVLSDQGILGCGVVNGPEVDVLGAHDSTPSACNGSPYEPSEPAADQPWPYQWLYAMGETKPNVVVLLAGRWEVVDRLYQGEWTNILNPVFAGYVKAQLNQASNLVTATGARMVFLTAPCTAEGEQPDGALPGSASDSPQAPLCVQPAGARGVAAEHPLDGFGGGPRCADLSARPLRHDDRGGHRPAHRRRALHHRRRAVPGAQDHAGDRGGGPGPGRRRRGIGLSPTRASGSRFRSEDCGSRHPSRHRHYHCCHSRRSGSAG